MGFSSALQGRAAHDALIIRQDAELRLMDTMKRCIQMKAKCDREYSISLAAVSQQGLKIDRADELQGSQITKSWRTFMDELDQQAKQFKLNAELLEVVCEKISHLSQDKRKARKSYQEEHSKIAARLNHLTDEVSRKKSDYQKHLEGYKALRTRFEEHYIKSGRSGRKLDDVRDKYQKACRKLHLTHNEYVLSITEAIEVEKDFRTVLLPGLLEHQESVQESFILLWKKILQEACQHSDLTSDKFHEIQKRIETVINNINPNEEYREFTEKHKTSPATPLVFQFDESLIEDIPGKLQASTLTVDNLTVDWLRSRLNDLEISVKDIQDKQEKLIGGDINGSPYLNGINNGSSGKDNQKHSKDLNSLKCQEKQKQKLADMIKSTLNEVGCEELPSGCDDHLAVEQNFIENTIINDQQTTLPSSNTSNHSVTSTIFQRGADVMLNIRVPFFKRRSTPSQPRSPPIKPRNRKKLTDSQLRSQSMGSLSVNSLDALERTIIIKKPSSSSDVIIDLNETNYKKYEKIINNKQSISLLQLSNDENNCVNFNNRPIIVGEIPKKKSLCAISVPNLNININTNTNNNNALDLDNTKLTNLTNNIYAELELNEQNCITTNNILESINEEQKIYSDDDIEKSIRTKTIIIADIIEEPKIIKTSIDDHLDKIDEINRILDENLRRTLTRSSSSTTPDIKTTKNETYVTIIDSNNDSDQYTNNFENIENEKKTNSGQIVKDEIIIIDNNNSNSLIIDSNLKYQNKPSTTATKEVQVNVKKRSTSFSHKLLTNFNNFKFSINSKQQQQQQQPIIKSIEDTEINEILNEVSILNIPSNKLKNSNAIDVASSNSSDSTTNRIENNNLKLLKNLKPKLKILDKKPKKSKIIRNTFRTKLFNFQIRRDKICENCSKHRKIFPNKSVFDFAKDFNNSSNNNNSNGVEIIDDNNDLCVCPNNNITITKDIDINNKKINTNNEICCEISATSSNEDILSIKDHTYCMPFIGDISYTTNRPLYEEEWFHGVLPREEVVRLLKIDGDFLVRETIRNEESQIVLSVCCRSGHKHFIVQTTIEGHFRFEGPKFPSIQELIIHQYQSELPVTVKSGVILRKPVLRERWELSNDDVVLIEKIGRGNFGDVYKAKLKSTKLDVAVKTCRMTLPDEQKRKFLQEGRILKQYDHPNIVKLIGICVQKQPIMIVMELVPGGSLLNFLRKNSNTLTPRQLMGMCRDASAGMRYLESKNCIHRDLAARNCLIDSENSVKISDFGMSREEEEYIVSDGMKQIPVKWTAPEALHFGKYTTLCDVWSYGILMWEIFSKGDTPYSGLSNSRAREKIDTGFRMPAPENTPSEIYRLMLKCWAAEAESRPHFDEIFTVVDALISRHDNS